MKKSIVVLVVIMMILALTSVVGVFVQNGQAKHMEQIQKDLASSQNALRRIEDKLQESQDTMDEIDELAELIVQMGQELDELTEKINNGRGQSFAGMNNMRGMRDMRERFSPERMAARSIEELGLEGEQAEQFKRLLEFQQERTREIMQGAMSSMGDPDARQRMREEMGEVRNDTNEQIRALLGDEVYAQYEQQSQNRMSMFGNSHMGHGGGGHGGGERNPH